MLQCDLAGRGSRKRSNNSSSDTIQKKQKVVEHKAIAFKNSLLKIIIFNKELKDVNNIGVFILDLLEHGEEMHPM